MKCSCNFTDFSGRTHSEFIQDMNNHFFNHRVQIANYKKYVTEETTRVFSDIKNENRTLSTFTSTEIIDKFTSNFSNWCKDKNRIQYDEFHHQQVLLFAETLSNNGIKVRKKNKRIDGFSDAPEDFYNAYAKPLNLLIWHYSLGGNKPLLDLTNDFEIITKLHPAFDSMLFSGLRGTFAEISGSTPSCVPKSGGYKYIKKKIDYYSLLEHVRLCMEKFEVPAIVLEAYWNN